MRPELWPEVEPLLEEVRSLPEESREEFLAAREGEKREACEAVRRLILLEPEVETFLERPALQGFLDREEPEAPELGDRVGAYRLVEILGVGGMGTVYLGRRDDQAFEGEVAVKILRRGLNARSFRRRFQQERQILASLKHPRIARLLDGGTTEDGRPYLILELVRGRPIDRYCEERQIGLEGRLRLMIQVCEAVDHAHRNLLVHRDLKPSNILVDDEGQSKLLDFGIAKILGEGALPIPLERTGTLFRPMTLPYASPEQVLGEPVTTASDTYSLGVILYRLLTGNSPYRLETGTGRELEDAILRQQPKPAGEATGSPGQSRKPAQGLPSRLLRGDLETILAKALRKEPERRYGGARELGEDLARVLGHRPIEARPDSRIYRFRKLVRRNPWASGAAATAALLLFLFAGVSSLQARRIAKERDAALEARLESQQVTEFLVKLLESASPEVPGGGADRTVQEVVQRSVEKLQDLSDRPKLKAQVASTLSRVYLSLELLGDAEPVVREALELRREVFEAPHRAIAESLGDMATWQRLTGNLTEAEAFQKEALEMWSEVQGEDSVEVAMNLNELGLVYYDQGRFDEAEPLLRRALGILEGRPDTEPRDLSEAHNNLAFALHAVGRYPEAEASYRKALSIWSDTGAEDHPFLASLFNNLASVLQEQGALEEADTLFRRSISMRRRIYGETHARVAAPINKLGWMKLYQGQLGEAEELFDEALRLRQDQFGGDHPLTAFSHLARARLWTQQGRLEAAADEARLGRDLLQGKLPEDHWRRRIGDLALGAALLRQGNLEEAEPLLLAAYRDLKATIGAAEPRTRDVLEMLIELYDARGDGETAGRLRQEVLPPAGKSRG